MEGKFDVPIWVHWFKLFCIWEHWHLATIKITGH
ncbi:hypothetical protein T08_9326 [Trichinella sp. T8]|nr:hypothetical protein T08_9326 [Trichinella sp. T8]